MKKATMWIVVAVVALFYFARRGLGGRAGTATVNRPAPKASTGDQLTAAATGAASKVIGAAGEKIASWFSGDGSGGSVDVGGSGPPLDPGADAYSDTTDSLGLSL